MNPQILEARNGAHLESVDCYGRRVERMSILADYLFRAVIEDDNKSYPSEIVSAVAFLADEVLDSRDEQQRIQDQLSATETELERESDGGEK